jgi:transcription initiation factor TFIIH subunit 2
LDFVEKPTSEDDAARATERAKMSSVEVAYGAEGEDGVDDDLAAEQQAASLRAFEKKYAQERAWEDLEEDPVTGRLRVAARAIEAEAREKRRKMAELASGATACKGMIRFMYLVVDLSRSACEEDFRPNRLSVVGQCVASFIREYFNQNPLSQLGIIVARNGVAERLTELSGSPEAHVSALRESLDASGDFSLQNTLHVARTSLRQIPAYGSREVVYIMSSLATCDPGNVWTEISAARLAKVRVSVCAVAAELHVARRLTEETGGTYGVSLNADHLEEIIMGHAPPPPLSEEATKSSLVQMGFPQKKQIGKDALTVGTGGEYVCPRCSGRIDELPSQCAVCRLTLVSSPHLARSYHHLFPVPAFVEYSRDKSSDEKLECKACLSSINDSANLASMCEQCSNVFCFACDVYIHTQLHNCPMCASGHRADE